MSIEKDIQELKAAVEALTAALVATAKLAPGSTGTTGSTAAAKPGAAAKATREEMVAVLKELGETKGAEVAKEIIKTTGKSAKMADIKDAQVNAVYVAAKAKLAEEATEEVDENGGL